jgi:hypothetical protein
MPKRRKRKTPRASEHRVYCTYFPDGRYYIGYSCKPEKQWEKYFGSSRTIKEEGTEELRKELIVTFPNKNSAKLQEMLLQLQHRHDPYCINDMIHVRLRLKYLNDFEPVDWEPKTYIELL